jgi:Protein of unknown function (DUF1592)/Protein of unknown function (DUF1588)/Protein of unknown function (DUF1595)/Protein of unknown function (DUF1587)/Protein of unknown function (DUF1585)
MRRLRTSSAAVVAAVLSLAGCTGSIGAPSGSKGGRDNPNPTGGGGNPDPVGGAIETPGRAPLRRLTNAQYNATVHALLGLEGDFAQGFGPDEQVGGFDSNSTVPVSATQVDKYGEVAEQLADQATTGAALARLAPCAPPAGDADACAHRFIPDFGKRAFRRPLTADEVNRYEAVYTTARGPSGDFAAGIKWVVTAMLQSPHFLYLPELGEAAGAASKVPLSPYEVATRLSYFFLGGMPDDGLFAAADARALGTPEQVATQARRLLATAKATDALVSFHRQWLMLDDILSTTKDENAFPDFTPALRQAMNDEIAAFVTGVLRDGDARLDTLLDADFSFVRGPLYGLYGLPAPRAGAPDVPTRVQFPAGQRAGILTLGGTLATFAHPDQSSPVARGFLVSDRLLCITPPQPPPNVDTSVPPPDPSVTTRQRLEAHRTNATCNACHGLMDPYGLTFEHYDGIGRYRAKDGLQPVDATATLPGIGFVNDAVDLMAHLATSDQVRRCMVQSWFRYGLGRLENEKDAATLGSVSAAFAHADYRVPELLVAMVSTDGFRYRAPLVP